MLSYKTFITETKLSQSNFDRMVVLMTKLIEKKTGKKYYRFGGQNGYVVLKKGTGVLLISANTSALRFNYVGGEVVSITIWDKYKLGASGDRTILLDGLNLVQVAHKIVDIIANKVKAGKFDIIPNPINEEVIDMYMDVLTEAKHIKLDAFITLVQKNLPAGTTINGLKWEEIADIMLMHGYSVPTAVRKTYDKSRKVFDLTKLVDVQSKKDAALEPIYHISITGQDPITKKFLSPQGDKKASQIMTMVKKAIESPSDEIVKQEMKNPDSLFGHLSDLVKLISRKSRNGLIVYGGPGTGKSYTVYQTLKEEGKSENGDYHVISGKITTSSLYQTLFLHRNGGILVFDDTDSVWSDGEAGNILKAALGDAKKRVVSWITGRTVNVSKMSEEDKAAYTDKVSKQLEVDPGDGKIRLPSQFVFDSRCIFISNLPFSKFDSAVVSRSSKIDMTLTQAQMFVRMETILPNLGDRTIPLDVKTEILDFLKVEAFSGHSNLTEISMRTYVAAEDLYKSGLPNWKELLDYV